MDSPPAATIRLGASWWYRAAVCVATVLLAVGFAALHRADNASGLTTATTLAWEWNLDIFIDSFSKNMSQIMGIYKFILLVKH